MKWIQVPRGGINPPFAGEVEVDVKYTSNKIIRDTVDTFTWSNEGYCIPIWFYRLTKDGCKLNKKLCSERPVEYQAGTLTEANARIKELEFALVAITHTTDKVSMIKTAKLALKKLK